MNPMISQLLKEILLKNNKEVIELISKYITAENLEILKKHAKEVFNQSANKETQTSSASALYSLSYKKLTSSETSNAVVLSTSTMEAAKVLCSKHSDNIEIIQVKKVEGTVFEC